MIAIDAEALKARGYGLEAIKRLRAGRSIVYADDGMVIEEYPDGRRYQMRLDADLRPIVVRKLSPAPR
jgi:hypothetical protein